MKQLSGRCILMVDCDAAGLAAWRARLLRQGARAICSSGSDSALANSIAFPAGTFDAAVIEHRPPELDAFELAEAIHSLPSMRALPIVAIGADAGDPAATEHSALITRLSGPVCIDGLVARLIRAFAPLAAPAGKSGSAGAPPSGYRGTVLIAEDDPVNAETLRGMLSALGLNVEVAADGEQAVARAAAGSFDLLLMDGQMPVMDGLAATREVRRQEAAHRNRLPVVGVTANRQAEYRDQCLAAGMDDVVHKPVGMSALLRVLARWLPQSARPVAPPCMNLGGPQLTPAQHAIGAALVSGPIDWLQVESLRSVDPQGALRLVDKAIGLYVDHAPRLIEEIRGYRSAIDLKSIQRAAHSLKSSSASLGANTVSGLSNTIERAAAAGDRATIESNVAALEAEYRRAAMELRKAGA